MSRGSYSQPAPGEVGVNYVNDAFHMDNTRTPVSSAFTSNYNVRYLMTEIQKGAYLATGVRIGPQSIIQLAGLMKSLYLRNGPYMQHIPDEEVVRLNRLVLSWAINDVSQGIQANARFIRDTNTQPVPPDRAMNTSSKGDRQFEVSYFL